MRIGSALSSTDLRARQRDSLGERVYQTLREHIVFVKLKPGEMINENQLAEALDVSRTPIREAIRLLLNEQLVEVLPQRGTRIARISMKKLKETLFIRQLLEIGAFRKAAVLFGNVRLGKRANRLRQLLDDQRGMADENDMNAFLKSDEEFHCAVMEIAGNDMLVQTVSIMRAHVNRARFLALDRFRHSKRVIEEHEALLDALDQGNERLTEERLLVHFSKIEREMEEIRDRYPEYFIT